MCLGLTLLSILSNKRFGQGFVTNAWNCFSDGKVWSPTVPNDFLWHNQMQWHLPLVFNKILFISLFVGCFPSWRSIFYHKSDYFDINITSFQSWVAIFHLRPRLAFLYHSSYDMPKAWSFYKDYQVSFLDRDMSWNAWNRFSWCYFVNIRILWISMKPICLQGILRRHPDRGTWTSFTSWKTYLHSYRFFSITGFR